MFSALRLCTFEQNYVFWCLCALFAVLIIYEPYSKRRHHRWITSKMPTAYGLPFLGIAYELVPFRKLLYVFESYFAKFKTTTYCAWLGPEPFIITMDPEVIREVLSSEDFLDKSSSMYEAIDYVMPNGIITSKVAKWKHNRKLMNSSFTHKILTSFIPIFNKGSKLAVARLDVIAGSGEHDVFEIIGRTTLQIAVETTMGISMENASSEGKQLTEGFNFLKKKVSENIVLSKMHLGFLVRTPKYHRTLRSFRSFVIKLVKQKFNTKDENSDNNQIDAEDIKKREEIFISQAIGFYERGLFQIDDVVTESLTLIAGALDTISTTIYSILVMLAMHSDVQEKLYEEVVAHFPLKDFEVTYDDLQHLPYMEMVINETLRLVPSIPSIAREAVKSTRLTPHITVPKGAQVLILIFNLHRRKDIWGPQADQFNPDNFLPGNNSEMHSYAYIPFSKGARNCIGWRYAYLSLRVMLIGLIRNFRYVTSFKYEDLVFVDSVSLLYDVRPLLQIERRLQDLTK